MVCTLMVKKKECWERARNEGYMCFEEGEKKRRRVCCCRRIEQKWWWVVERAGEKEERKEREREWIGE